MIERPRNDKPPTARFLGVTQMAKFKVKDEFELKKVGNFTRSIPHGGYNRDGSVRNPSADIVSKTAGSIATVYEIHDVPANSTAKATYFLDFGDLKVSLNERRLLELFEPVE
jgi:hypothetical protein